MGGVLLRRLNILIPGHSATNFSAPNVTEFSM